MSAYYRFEFRPYSRSFKRPLQTHHGLWNIRRGIVIRLVNSTGQIGWGEIAPVDFFGTESIEQALEFCRSLPSEIAAETIAQVPAHLPACQFGFGAAQEMVAAIGQGTQGKNVKSEPFMPLIYSHLLPTGAAALQAWQLPWQQGTQTFKWKIGVAPIDVELAQFEQLIAALPPEVRLRLDANGGLSVTETIRWLQCCDALLSRSLTSVEFLEQPLPPHQFTEMLRLKQQFETPIALDESVCSFSQLETYYQHGWRGIFVVKAAIAGFPHQLRQFCQQYPIDIVWSSVFETTVAQYFIQHYLIPAVPASARAVGFGVNQWFTDSHLDSLNLLDPTSFEQLWCNL